MDLNDFYHRFADCPVICTSFLTASSHIVRFIHWKMHGHNVTGREAHIVTG